MRDQRHSYAVRAARAGTPAELIARQLGHADAVLVLKVYGRFMPSQQDRDKWEMIADLQDKEAAATATEPCTVLGTAPRNDMSQPQSSDWPINSRGGTRTRDPGIMREGAVGRDVIALLGRRSTRLHRAIPNGSGFGSAGGTPSQLGGRGERRGCPQAESRVSPPSR
jgi:hypothetical protein